MKYYLYSFLLTLASLTATAQSDLVGYLVDTDTGESIAFATVYINGTTSGAVTDDDGFFELEASDYPCELVVSHLNYQSTVFNFQEAPAETLRLGITARKVDLQEVEVLDTDQRAKNLKEFLPNFLGMDELGEEASLKNPEALFFKRDYIESKRPKSIRIDLNGTKVSGPTKTIRYPLNLQASSRQQLLIEQPETGYVIHCDLIHFQLNYARGNQTPGSMTLGYYFFEPMESRRDRQQRKWEKARREAYYNSQQHFLYALYHQQLREEGYLIFERVSGVGESTQYRPFPLLEYLRETPDSDRTIEGLEDKMLEIFYYPKGVPGPNQNLLRGNPQRSLVRFMEDSCPFRANGTAPDTSIQFGGLIAEKKTGAMLPDNYRPEEG
jgi:hypothetical protein